MKAVSLAVFALLLLVWNTADAQNAVGIGTSSPHPSAAFEVRSGNKGLLLPALNTQQRNAVANPAKGLLAYDSALAMFYYHNGNDWQPLNNAATLNTDNSLVVGKQSGPPTITNMSSDNRTTIYSSDSSGIIYDNGGPNGNYSNNANHTFVVSPNYMIGIRFELTMLDTESPFDSLIVEIPEFGFRKAYTGNQTDTFTVGNLRYTYVRFKSNSTNTKQGFVLKWFKLYPARDNLQPFNDQQLTGWYYNAEKMYMRGGLNLNNSWHPDSSGKFSFAFGTGGKATGANSFAMGNESEARGAYSYAMGDNAKAVGSFSYALGGVSYAGGISAIALGSGAVAKGQESLAGPGSSAEQYRAFAGPGSNAKGGFSTALNGGMTIGDRTLAVGFDVVAKFKDGVVIGVANDTTEPFNNPLFNNYPLDRIFQIGNGTPAAGANYRYSNAMTVLRNGNVGIGTTTPSDKLVVDGNTIVNSGLALDVSGTNAGTMTNSLRFGNWNSGEGIASKRTAGGNQFGLDFFTSSTARLSITGSGNVGIGTTTPTDKLEVNGNTLVSGNLTVQSNKGIIRSNSSVQQKKVTSSVAVSGTITSWASQVYNFTFPEAFSGPPDVYVGDCSTTSTGGWAEVIMTVGQVTATSATLYVHNPRTTSQTVNYSVKIIAIGPQ